MSRTQRVPPPPPPPPRWPRRAAVGLLVAGAVALAYVAGRDADGPPAREARPVPIAAPAADPAAWPEPSPSTPPLRTSAAALPDPHAAPTAPPAVAPAAPKARAAPEVVARVREDLGRRLEAARPELAERCVPERRRGGPPARVTFNVTYDASGREIARGISEDRRAPAPEVAACLRELPIGSLAVPAPGAVVGVRALLTLP